MFLIYKPTTGSVFIASSFVFTRGTVASNNDAPNVFQDIVYFLFPPIADIRTALG